MNDKIIFSIVSYVENMFGSVEESFRSHTTAIERAEFLTRENARLRGSIWGIDRLMKEWTKSQRKIVTEIDADERERKLQEFCGIFNVSLNEYDMGAPPLTCYYVQSNELK